LAPAAEFLVADSSFSDRRHQNLACRTVAAMHIVAFIDSDGGGWLQNSIVWKSFQLVVSGGTKNELRASASFRKG
jgi:hypothetical protein